jgi:hypothetical protein
MAKRLTAMTVAHNANDHIRLGEMERFRKAVLGEGIRINWVGPEWFRLIVGE